MFIFLLLNYHHDIMSNLTLKLNRTVTGPQKLVMENLEISKYSCNEFDVEFCDSEYKMVDKKVHKKVAPFHTN